MYRWSWRSQIAVLATAALVGACGGEIIDAVDEARGEPDGSGTASAESACASRTPTVSTSDGWRSIQASQPSVSSLRFELKARPTLANLDGVVAVGGKDIADFSDAAISIRFAEDGHIDARDGAGYSSDVSFVYEAGVWYDFVIRADVSAQTYDVEVGRCGESLQALISGAAFRFDASVTDQLTDWAVWSAQGAGLGVSVPTWTVFGNCAPATCDLLGSECGQLDDGCGGSLSCGDCGVSETCESGSCVEAPVSVPPPPPPPPPGGGPSDPPDSCTPHAGGSCCDGGFSFSPCPSENRYVRPGGGGARDGSDWTNALDGLPASLNRGTVYWLGSGSFGSYDFDDPPSGEAGVTLRKATAAVHGTDTGWNSSFGSGQAVFGPLRFSTDRYTLDGGEPNGIKAVGQMGTNAVTQLNGSRVVLRHIEIDGGLQKSNGTQTAGACIGADVEGDYVVFDRCEVHNIADDGLGIYADHVKVLYSKIHDLDGCGTDGGCGPCNNGHSDGLEISSAADLELVGNIVYDVRSTAAIFMENWGGGDISDLVVYNNVFYTPETGITVYLKDLNGAKFHNNIIWGRTQGNRFGGLSIGNDVTNLDMFNNIILNINYSHAGASQDPSQHRLDYNLFGMINSDEYSINAHDLVADPQFAGIPMSSDPTVHKGGNLWLDDFVPSADAAIDTGTTPSGVPASDVVGQQRPQGSAWDRGPFESP